MTRIDLHTHSTASDGTDTPAELVAAARAAGVSVLALTDHDTVDGHQAAIAALHTRPDGLVLVPGIELSCLVDDVSLHLLGYLFDAADQQLTEQVRLLRTDRVRRARAMVDKLAELEVPISWPQVERIAAGGAVGRPHVALALVAAGVVPDVPAAFSAEWIGDGGRAYVPKYSLVPEQAIELVKASGGVTVFAHPGASSRGAIVTDGDIERFARAGLDGLEVDHPDHDAPTRARLRALAGDLGLLVTGSSDYHGSVKATPIGAETTHESVFEELVARASGAPVRA